MRRKVLLAVVPLLLANMGFAQLTTVVGIKSNQPGVRATAAPDPTVAVGKTEFCEHVNNAYQCWNKSTLQPVFFLGSTNPKSNVPPWSQNGNNFGNTPNCPTASTPNGQILHDNVYSRWIMQKRITATNGHNYMCVAISNGEDMSVSTFRWFAFEYDLNKVIPKNAQGNYYFPDFPQAGLWQTQAGGKAGSDQAMWITYDLQDVNNSFNNNGVLVCAVDLTGLRASTSNPWVNRSHSPACAVAHPLVAYNQRRSWVPANNSDNFPPIASDGEMFTYVIEPPRDGKSYLTSPTQTMGVEQWTISWTAATPTPTFVNSWNLPSTQPSGDQLACFNPNNYYFTACIPQPSTAVTGVPIDSVGDRMQQPFSYSSNNGHGSTWTAARSIQILPSATQLTQTEANVRILTWNTATPPAISVASDFAVTDPLDASAYVFLPSLARDKVGNLLGIIATSGPGSVEHPGIASVYLNPGPTVGSYGYVANPASDGDAEDTDAQRYRWGDWSGAVLDPSDSCSVWVVGEYLPSNRTTSPFWYTAIAKLPALSNCF